MLSDHKYMGLSPVSLIYISISVQCHTVLMTVALQCSLKSGSLISAALFFFFEIDLDVCGLCF